ERVAVADVLRTTGHLHGDIGMTRERDHLRYGHERRIIDIETPYAEVIDDELETRMALCDLADERQKVPRQQRDRDAEALSRRPQPVHGAVVRPGLHMGLEERVAQAAHAGLLEPGLDQRTLVGFIQRNAAEDREALGL